MAFFIDFVEICWEIFINFYPIPNILISSKVLDPLVQIFFFLRTCGLFRIDIVLKNCYRLFWEFFIDFLLPFLFHRFFLRSFHRFFLKFFSKIFQKLFNNFYRFFEDFYWFSKIFHRFLKNLIDCFEDFSKIFRRFLTPITWPPPHKPSYIQKVSAETHTHTQLYVYRLGTHGKNYVISFTTLDVVAPYKTIPTVQFLDLPNLGQILMEDLAILCDEWPSNFNQPF